jgi:hypothetical protein
MPLEDRALTTEHVVEVRFRAFGRLLDIRGRIADWITDHSDFTFWSVSENRVEFRLSETSQRETAFVGHRNLGYAVRRPDTRNYLPDRALHFVGELLRVDEFELRPFVRVGVRLRVLFPFQGEFAALLRRVNERVPVHNNLVEPFHAEVEDVGPVLILRRGDRRIQVKAGPMAQEQSQSLMQGYDNLPLVGFYLDQDHYQTENLGHPTERDLAHLVRSFSTAAWEAVDFYNRLLF